MSKRDLYKAPATATTESVLQSMLLANPKDMDAEEGLCSRGSERMPIRKPMSILHMDLLSLT